MAQESYIAKIKREALEKKAGVKDTQTEKSPPSKDAGGRSRASGSEGYKPAKNQKLGPSYTTGSENATNTKDNTEKSATSFGKAFSGARKEGKKTFMWKGKSYTTKRADDKPKSTIKSQDAKLNLSNAEQPDYTSKDVEKKDEPKKVEPEKVDTKKVTRNSTTIDKIKKSMGIGRKATAKEDMGRDMQGQAQGLMQRPTSRKGMKHGGSVKTRSINGIAQRGLTKAKHK